MVASFLDFDYNGLLIENYFRAQSANSCERSPSSAGYRNWAFDQRIGQRAFGVLRRVVYFCHNSNLS
jgi:hypothetical protein